MAQQPKLGSDTAESGLETEQGKGRARSIPRARTVPVPAGLGCRTWPWAVTGPQCPSQSAWVSSPAGTSGQPRERHQGHGAAPVTSCPSCPTAIPDLPCPPHKSHISSGSHSCYLCLKYSSSQHSEDTNGMQILVESLRGPHSPTYKVLNKMQ